MTITSPVTIAVSEETELAVGEFSVTLDNFQGPFDLLLSLIAKHKLDVTQIALSQVTDEFLAYIRLQGARWDLDQTSSFLVVAATLLDWKTARLLPHGVVDDDEDLEVLEARDLLFARLLQYRAFKQLAGWIESTWFAEAKRHPRPGGLEERFAVLRPDVELGLSPEQFAQIALTAMTPTAQTEVFVEHIWVPTVSVADQATLLAGRLQSTSAVTFRSLIADAATRLVVVARFLAVLELFRADLVVLEQLHPLADLVIRWVGEPQQSVDLLDEYDQEPGDDQR